MQIISDTFLSDPFSFLFSINFHLTKNFAKIKSSKSKKQGVEDRQKKAGAELGQAQPQLGLRLANMEI